MLQTPQSIPSAAKFSHMQLPSAAQSIVSVVQKSASRTQPKEGGLARVRLLYAGVLRLALGGGGWNGGTSFLGFGVSLVFLLFGLLFGFPLPSVALRIAHEVRQGLPPGALDGTRAVRSSARCLRTVGVKIGSLQNGFRFGFPSKPYPEESDT